MIPLLEVADLTVHAGEQTLVNAVSFQLKYGQCLTILGQTGAGKSLLAQAIMGLLPSGLTCTGSVRFNGIDVMQLEASEREALWGRQICMLPQEPWHALDPLMRACRQVGEVFELVHEQRVLEAQRNAAKALTEVDLRTAMHKYPWQLSGGMAQRVAWCAATAAGGELVLADEPTKGLDAGNRDGITRLLRGKADRGAVLTITHDVEVARQMGGHIMVMRNGNLLEQGDAATILGNATAAYTRALIAAAPCNWPRDALKPELHGDASESVLSARDLAKSRDGCKVINGFSVDIYPGEVIGVTGASGSGKSTLGDMLLGVLRPDSGVVKRAAGVASHRYLKLYQDPPAAFAPSVPLGVLFDEVMRLHTIPADQLLQLLDQLELSPALLTRSAAEVSGGELQRLALARALLLKPVFLFADEPVSRLDPITAKSVVQMLVRIASERGCAVMLVSHDPELVERTCHRTLHIHHQQ